MPTISHVLCPIDFSETSRHAVDQAVAIAGWYRARLTVLHVHAPVFIPGPDVPAATDHLFEIERQRLQSEAKAFVHLLLGAAITPDVVIDVGRPAADILARAASLPADLIVMGTHGAGGFEHLVLGSVAEKVLRKAQCPVLTVPPRVHARSRFPFVSVLCGVDFSEWSSAALELASSLAQESGATLELVHVIEWSWEEPPSPSFEELPADQAATLMEFRRYLAKSATSRLEALASDAVRSRCPVITQVAHGKPYRELLREAEETGADLIVLGLHGRHPLDLALFGSTTNQVIRRATCPVLTLRR